MSDSDSPSGDESLSDKHDSSSSGVSEHSEFSDNKKQKRRNRKKKIKKRKRRMRQRKQMQERKAKRRAEMKEKMEKRRRRRTKRKEQPEAEPSSESSEEIPGVEWVEEFKCPDSWMDNKTNYRKFDTLGEMLEEKCGDLEGADALIAAFKSLDLNDNESLNSCIKEILALFKEQTFSKGTLEDEDRKKYSKYHYLWNQAICDWKHDYHLQPMVEDCPDLNPTTVEMLADKIEEAMNCGEEKEMTLSWDNRRKKWKTERMKGVIRERHFNRLTNRLYEKWAGDKPEECKAFFMKWAQKEEHAKEEQLPWLDALYEKYTEKNRQPTILRKICDCPDENAAKLINGSFTSWAKYNGVNPDMIC